MHSFTLGGENCRDYGIMVSGEKTFNAPEPDVTVIEIPGRNGSLTIDNGRFKNVTVTYPAVIYGNFANNARRARAWLCSVPGYRRLEDDYDPDTYRMARIKSGLEFSMWANNRAGECKIQFDCLPQRFLKSGENTVTKSTSGGYITNPTQFKALPLIVVYGSGSCTLTVGDYMVEISEIGTSVTMDCEIMRAYNGNTPRDSTITGPFPVLVPGRNNIRFDGGVTRVEITPRWWII